jgi:ribosomal protein S27E
MGGPGLDGYAYHASVYCVDCGREIVEDIAADVAPKLSGTDDPLFSDSETLPQPIFFGESDTAQHCDKCGAYLYGPQIEESKP